MRKRTAKPLAPKPLLEELMARQKQLIDFHVNELTSTQRVKLTNIT